MMQHVTGCWLNQWTWNGIIKEWNHIDQLQRPGNNCWSSVLLHLACPNWHCPRNVWGWLHWLLICCFDLDDDSLAWILIDFPLENFFNLLSLRSTTLILVDSCRGTKSENHVTEMWSDSHCCRLLICFGLWRPQACLTSHVPRQEHQHMLWWETSLWTLHLSFFWSCFDKLFLQICPENKWENHWCFLNNKECSFCSIRHLSECNETAMAHPDNDMTKWNKKCVSSSSTLVMHTFHWELQPSSDQLKELHGHCERLHGKLVLWILCQRDFCERIWAAASFWMMMCPADRGQCFFLVIGVGTQFAMRICNSARPKDLKN